MASLAHLVQTHGLTPVREAARRTGKIGRLLTWKNAGDDAHVALVVDLGLAFVDEALENACGSVTIGFLLFNLPQTVLKFLDLLCLLPDLLILGSLFGSGILNLCFCTSSLGAHF